MPRFELLPSIGLFVKFNRSRAAYFLFTLKFYCNHSESTESQVKSILVKAINSIPFKSIEIRLQIDFYKIELQLCYNRVEAVLSPFKVSTLFVNGD